ncbi:MAG: hypothetical protein ACI9J3_001022 [Parvicellaceae bacterium]|jgi:hypothetical protein
MIIKLLKSKNIIKIFGMFFLISGFVSCGEEESEIASKASEEDITQESINYFENQTFEDSVAYLEYRLQGLDRNLMLDFFQEYGFDSINVFDQIIYPNEGSASRVLNHFISLIDSEEYEEMSFTTKDNWPRLNYWENVLLNLPEESNYNVTYSGYLERKAEERSFATFLYSLDRSPDNLQRAWTLSRDAAFLLVNKDKYYQSKYYRYVDGLLQTYEYILDKDEPSMVLDMLSRKLSNGNFYSTWDSRYLYQDYVPLTLLKEFSDVVQDMDLEDSEYFRSENITVQSAWFVSFWQRRYTEGNLEIVLRILNDIQDHYESQLMAETEFDKPYDISKTYDSIAYSSGLVGKGTTFSFKGDVYDGSTNFAKAANKLIMFSATNIPLGETIEPIPTATFQSKEMLEEINQIGLDLMAHDVPYDSTLEENYAYELTTSIDGIHNQFVTLKISTWSFTGGAHGNGYSAYHIFDCSADSIINPREFVIRKTELLNKIKEELLIQYSPDPETTLSDLLIDNVGLAANISLSDGKLHFHYNAYEIGPYSIGAPTVSFPIIEMRRYFLLDL